MKAQASWAVLLLCLGCAQSAAWAQKAPAQRTIAVVVVDAHAQPPQPVPTVRVELDYLDGSVSVSESRDVTNPKGQAWLVVSQDVAQRGGLHIEIDGAKDLVIYQPADGQLAALPATITVSMLPKGSPALLGPAQIEAMLHRTLVQVNALQKQVSTLKQNAAATQSQKPDLGAAIAEWAVANGFSSAQVDQQVQQWAQGIEQQSAQATTAEQKALAELALKHYENAAQLFNAAGDADRQQISSEDTQEQSLEAQVKALQAAQQSFLNKQRTTLQQLLDHSQQAAGAYQLNLQYHQATQALASAETAMEAEYKKHADDKGFHELWLEALWAVAMARLHEGGVSPANQSLPLLAQSADDLATLVREKTALGDRRDAAVAQNGVGNALKAEGERAPGDKAAALLDQSVQAYRSALLVFTRTDLPQDWAMAQTGLGMALEDEGQRASGDKAAALFNQAVQAFRSALEVRTKAALPQDWAMTQITLGDALGDEGERASGDKAAALFDEAVQADRSALEVYIKADQPQEWAMAQNNLGLALWDEGERASGDKAAALLDQAVQAYQNALQIFTKADLPQNWATTQGNLGIALWNEAKLTTGDKAPALLNQAVQAYRSALEVRTKADLPQDWAVTQINLGNALGDEGERASGDQATALFDQAVQAYRSALEVDTKADLPQIWATTQSDLGIALLDEGERATGDQAAALIEQAVQAFQSALEVRTKADLPQDWASTQHNLGNALIREGERASGEKAVALLDQAVQAFRSALEVFTQADLPQDWANTQVSLGTALDKEAMRASGDQAAALFDQAVQAYRSALVVYTKADLPQDWARTQLNLGIVLEHKKDYSDAAEAQELALEVYPDRQDLFEHLSDIYHDHLFRFEQAYELDERRTHLDSSIGTRMDFLEASLTADHFAGCLQQAAAIQDQNLPITLLLVRNVIKFACQWGAGQKADAQGTMRDLLVESAQSPQKGWDFTGTLHYLATSPVFAPGRDSWIALFTGIQNGDSAGMTAALHQLEPILQP